MYFTAKPCSIVECLSMTVESKHMEISNTSFNGRSQACQSQNNYPVSPFSNQFISPISHSSSTHLFILLFIYPSSHLSSLLSIHLPITHSFILSFIYTSTHLPIHHSISPSIHHPPPHPFIFPSICPSISSSIHPPAPPPAQHRLRPTCQPGGNVCIQAAGDDQ